MEPSQPVTPLAASGTFIRVAIFLGLTVPIAILFCQPTSAIDDVTFKQDGKTIHAAGKAIVSAQDGGLMILTPDGQMWPILPEEMLQHQTDDKPFTAYSADELKKHVLADLPDGFESYSTAHYLIFHNTSRAYAQWCSALLERLFASFQNFWTHRGFKLKEPTQPLVVVIYATRDMYNDQSAEELKGRRGVIGYYSLQTNRVKMFDLTGLEALRSLSDNRKTDAAQINQLLARPEGLQMVATIIHEATHQIAFNCGLQQRFADIPLWVCEGLAEYFETPDMNYGKGWRTIGEVNPPRIARFQQYLARRPNDSLQKLIVDDKRFRTGDTQQVLDAYAEAWALNYFLLRQHAKQYQNYLELMAQKPPLVGDEPAVRLKEFEDCFGDDLAALDAEFVRYMVRVK